MKALTNSQVILTEEQIRSLNNEVALAMHAWIRDETYGRPMSRLRAANSVGAWIESVTGHAQTERLLKQSH